MSTDAQTQAIPRVPAEVLSVSGDRIATARSDAENPAPGQDAEAEVTGPDGEVATADVDAEAEVTGPDGEVATADVDPEAEVTGPDGEVATADVDAEVAAPGSDGPITLAASIQEMYEAGLATLDALHDRWAAAMAEIREVTGGPDQAAA